MNVPKQAIGLLAASLMLLTGCGSNMLEFAADKNSDAATREAAQILIDRGDYNAALALLTARCPNLTCASADDAQQLAAAYMGAAGLDVLDLVKQSDQDSGSSAQGTDFTTISGLLPAITADNFTKIDSAVTLLSNIGTKTDDQILQLSIAQLTSATIAIGLAGGGGFDSDGIPNSCSGDCSAGNVTSILAASLTTAAGNATTAGAYVTSAINGSVSNVNSIAALADSDIADQVNDLAADMQGSTTLGSCATSGGVPSGSVSQTNIGDYLTYCI